MRRWFERGQRLVSDAGASLLLRPGHTIGMIAGIVLGVAGVVGIVVMADTQQVQVDRQFDLQRSDLVVVRAMSPTPEGFSSQQMAAVRNLEPVSGAGEFSIWSGGKDVSLLDKSRVSSRPILVADPFGMEATQTRVVAGHPAAELATAHGPIAWIGESLAHDLGIPSSSNLRDAQILVDGHAFQVVGIVANHAAFTYTSAAVLIPRNTAIDVLGGTAENMRAIAHVRPGSAKAVGDYMVVALDPTLTLALNDVTPPDGKILLNNVGSDLRRIGAALGGFMGVVSMITVANTLMMAVHQRRRELGLRSAMGWSRGRIGLLVLTESAIAGMVASVLGVGVGLGVAWMWSHFQHWELILAPWLPFSAIGAGVGASVLGGIIPAYLAASTSPMTAMRS